MGAGSVGKRHMQNLKKLGCKVSVMDPRLDRLREAEDAIGVDYSYKKLEDVGDLTKFKGIVIASPPKYHVDQCIWAIESGISVLLEKPMCKNKLEAERLIKVAGDNKDAKVLLGYTYRWWPPLREFRQRIRSGVVGKPLYANFVMSAHLEDWHPWEPYQDFFMSDKDLGGGALLDESHFLDLMLWIFGMPERIYGRVERLSSLEIETDDNVDILASYSNGLRVHIHLDLFGRPHQKHVEVFGEGRTLRWSFEPNRLVYGDESQEAWDQQDYQFERNDMFINEAIDFLEILEGQNELTCTIGEGLQVMRLIEACRESTKSGCECKL